MTGKKTQKIQIKKQKGYMTNFFKQTSKTILKKLSEIPQEIYKKNSFDLEEYVPLTKNGLDNIIEKVTKVFLENGEINPESDFAETYAISLYHSATTHYVELKDKIREKQILEAEKIFDRLTKKTKEFSLTEETKKKYQSETIYFPDVEDKIGKLGYYGTFVYAQLCIKKNEFPKAKKLFKTIAEKPLNCAPARMKKILEKSLETLLSNEKINLSKKDKKKFKTKLNKFKKKPNNNYS